MAALSGSGLRESLRLAAVILGVLAVIHPAFSGEDLERSVKAAFISKFSGYVEWPASAAPAAETPLVIGVVGDESLADELKRLIRARPADARPMSVVRLKAFDAPPALHVLFIGRSEADRLGALIRSVRGRPVLVVTDTENALALGSMINFDLVDGHVRFQVGLGAARKAGLTLSSRLLAVAHQVMTRTP